VSRKKDSRFSFTVEATFLFRRVKRFEVKAIASRSAIKITSKLTPHEHMIMKYIKDIWGELALLKERIEKLENDRNR
jgi:hypothetical protein